MEVTPGFEPGNQGFADPCLTTWLCHHLYCIICELSKKVYTFFKKFKKFFPPPRLRHQRSNVAQKWGPRRNPAKRFRWGSEGIPNIVQFSPKAETERCWEFQSWSGQRGSNSLPPPWQGGALPDELCPHTGRLCDARWCPEPESNQRHVDFQSTALPTELSGQVATRNGLEPSTSSVTG